MLLTHKTGCHKTHLVAANKRKQWCPSKKASEGGRQFHTLLLASRGPPPWGIGNSAVLQEGPHPSADLSSP